MPSSHTLGWASKGTGALPQLPHLLLKGTRGQKPDDPLMQKGSLPVTAPVSMECWISLRTAFRRLPLWIGPLDTCSEKHIRGLIYTAEIRPGTHKEDHGRRNDDVTGGAPGDPCLCLAKNCFLSNKVGGFFCALIKGARRRGFAPSQHICSRS